MARRAEGAPGSVLFAELVITIASAVAFARMLVEIGVVAPGILREAGPPLGVVLGTMIAAASAMYFFVAEEKVELPEAENPASLGPALAFAAVYTIVTLASAAAEHSFGAGALYAVAVVAGLTDVDAITLSIAEMAARGALPGWVAWRVILVAALSNLAFKLGIVWIFGRKLAPRVALSFGAATAVGVLLILFWPGG
jgi:uncharacterized membrane protein (DUF4010 family)